MRKISVEIYKYEAVERDVKTGVIRTSEKDYDVPKILTGFLFNPTLNLGVDELIAAGKISTKILSAKKDVLLEESEYQTLLSALMAFKGYNKPDLELVSRVKNAETVEVNVEK